MDKQLEPLVHSGVSMSLYAQIEAFIAVTEQRSFTKAAHKLGVTPTAVSKHIKLLEEHINLQLLTRNTRSVQVTEVGEQFYRHCKRIEYEMQQASAYIHSQRAEPQGLLRIHSSIYFGQAYLQQLLPEFNKLYPKVQIEIELSDNIPNLERDQFDLLVGFSMFPQIPKELRYRKLFTTHYVLCASQKYLDQYGVPHTPHDLQHHKILNHPLRVPNNVIRFENGEEITVAYPDIIVNSLEMLIYLCCAGLGIFQSAYTEVAKYIKAGKLIELLPNYSLGKPTIYLFYRYTQYELTKVRAFIEFLISKMPA